jgi:hypothetical protein
VLKLAFFNMTLDPSLHLAAKINRKIHCAQPGSPYGFQGVTCFARFSARRPTGKTFDAHLVAAPQEPAQFFLDWKMIS